MKIIRFDEAGRAQYGLVEGETVFRATGSPFAGPLTRGAAVGPVHQLKVLAPASPPRSVCAGKNFPWGENPAKSPGRFSSTSRPVRSIGHQADIVYPALSQRVISRQSCGGDRKTGPPMSGSRMLASTSSIYLRQRCDSLRPGTPRQCHLRGKELRYLLPARPRHRHGPGLGGNHDRVSRERKVMASGLSRRSTTAVWSWSVTSRES